MKDPIRRFYEFIDRPLFGKTRVLLALLVVPLALAFTRPLWRISMEAPQYPEGLHLDIYVNGLRGGNQGQHLQEINTLNHYIGMHAITQEAIPDLDWMPFALGILMLLTLRVAAIGAVRHLLDLSVLSLYILGFLAARFVYRLYVYGHELDPHAPVKIEPFMPVVLGTKQIANFTTHSWPLVGTLYVAAFAFGVAAITLWHLVTGYRRARREQRQSLAPRA